MSEGVIKFSITQWNQTPPLDISLYSDIERVRKKLYKLELIGCYKENNLGYGNISKLLTNNTFVISGTQTGHLADLNGEHYSIVESVNFNTNSLICSGFCKPSSEAITHAAFYKSNPKIKSVIHVHNLELWQRLINTNELSTPPDAEYGSVKLYESIIALLKNRNEDNFIVVMKGHREGIIAAGSNIDSAFLELMITSNLIKTSL